MKIFIGSDHAGYMLKKELIKFLKEQNHDVEDMGPISYDRNDDYPDYIFPTAQKVAETSGSLGIVLGGSGQGEAMAANKVKGIRAAVYYGGKDIEIVKLFKEHNNTNVLSLGGRNLGVEEARAAVKLWIDTPFSEKKRHIRRIKKISEFEK